MPDRLIRDELLTSERYWSVSIEAQRLFIHLLLVADDLARFSGKNFTIRSACFPGQAIAPEKVERMLAELQDLDLIRLYDSGGDRYIFIPRFGQRLRYKNSKFPAPPSEINDIPEEKSVSRPTVAIPQPDPSLLKRREEKRREEKKGADAPLSADQKLWRVGLDMLTSAGKSEEQARTILGRHYKQDKAKLARVIGEMAQSKPIDPVAYLQKAMTPEKKKVAL